jgi:hypothetical protein
VAGDQFHRDVEHRRADRDAIALGRAFADVVDRDEVRMVECRCGARLLDEPLQPIGIARQILPQDLEREVAAKHHVPGEIHLAHPATGDQARDVETPDGGCR